MVDFMLRDAHRPCCNCGPDGSLDFVEIPASVRTYVKEGAEYQDYFGPSRDYECRNCGAAFTLTDWETNVLVGGEP